MHDYCRTRPHTRLRCILASLCCLSLPIAAPVVAVAEDWPQFRGPGGQGHSSETGLPLEWSETENVVWKTALPGLGWSSPVIVGDDIWLTTALDAGRSLRAICVDRNSGKIRHNIEVFTKDDPGSIHTKNSHASPTPVIDGDRVFVHYGAHGTGCVSRDGRVLWKTTDLKYYHRHGPASSPVVYDDLLIVSCDGFDMAFVVGLDKATGQVRWRTTRDGPHAYCTPLVVRVGGADQVICPGGNQIVAYEPRSGKEIWRFRYDGYSVVPRPVVGHGLLFFCSGYENPVLYAIRPDGQGDVTGTHEAWKRSRSAPHNPSPLLVGDELYTVTDLGVASCLDARTGKEHWRERLGGSYSASPLAADGRIYFLNEDGTTIVIAPGTTFQKLATNAVEGRTQASLAVSRGSIYLRTDTHLYRIELPKGGK